ncbi:TetR/AcrR family transcriptional regulator C-terminal domain-containing protein [Actinopolymorpha pittospori]
MAQPVANTDPPSVRILTEIRRRITTGELRAGDRVPSTRQITQQWGVAMATATKVLTALREEGLVRVVPGVGTVVDAAAGPSHRRTPRRRDVAGSEPELTSQRIVATATSIADTEGLAAVTMRRLATELDVATMSIYRHVRGKDQLVFLMADAAFGEDVLPADPPHGWRAQLELVCRVQWTSYRRHPWLAHIVSLTRPLLSVNALAHTEWTMRALDGLGLDPTTQLHMATTVANYVRGTATNLEREAQAEQDTGITDDEWMRARGPALTEMLAAGSFPIMASVAGRSNVNLDLGSLFEFGLQRLLDGFAAVMPK